MKQWNSNIFKIQIPDRIQYFIPNLSFSKQSKLSVAVKLTIASLFWSSQVAALPDNNGKEFILGFLPNLSTPSLELHITSDVVTDVTVQYPLNNPNFDKTVSVSPGQVTVLSMPQSSHNWSPDLVANNAIHAFASEEFTLYMVNRASATSDATLGLPIDVLDMDYTIMSYPAQPHGASEFLVVATEDNTTVSITPSLSSKSSGTFSENNTPLTENPTAPYGNAPNVPLVAPMDDSLATLDLTPFSITLNRGEGYFVYSKSSDFTATSIQSDKPISVMNGNQCANVNSSYTACDHIFQMAPPISTWGTTALVSDLPDRPNGTVYRILAAQDDTTILQNGSTLAVLNKGEFYDTGELAGSHIFEAEKPFLVTAFMTGVAAPGATTGDPAMGNIVPPQQFSNRYTFSTVDGGQFSEHHLQVLADNTEVGTITLDGSPIGANNFTAIGDTGYSVANLSLAEGSHTTSSKLGHGILVMGFNQYDSYLYAGGSQFGGLIDNNDPPIASDVKVAGVTVVDETLTASYTYSDTEDDLEGDTAIQWLRADDVNGLNKTVISGATDKIYTPKSVDLEKFIGFEVTPVAQTGTTIGKPVESQFVGPVIGEVVEHGQLQFESKNYSVKEDKGTISAVVTRTNGSDGNICVTYSSADATAISPDDYASISESICWEDGETTAKVLKINIVDDSNEEESETFKLNLSDVEGGATIGSPSIAIVTIIDNDDAKDDCVHATYSTDTRELTLPFLDIPLLDPITGEPTGGIAVFEGDLNLINGVDDFKVVSDSISFIEMLEGDSECHATYSYIDRVMLIPFVDVPSVMVLPPGIVVPGPTQVFEVELQQLPLSDDVFHLKGYKHLYTIEN
ncbi:Calx-beta domain-containing protein [Candidatus Albibeggiatoa sp. nov. NOAA]|uniref:Calx-beta domain-containing protein n=1 Tax=Candidatus Albibeggiatoa sp. nov. NOAA TaxID=3162724 RepID=UPI003303CCE9|nr:hypothetical protein [Thiotrichaceae bacterium]